MLGPGGSLVTKTTSFGMLAEVRQLGNLGVNPD